MIFMYIFIGILDYTIPLDRSIELFIILLPEANICIKYLFSGYIFFYEFILYKTFCVETEPNVKKHFFFVNKRIKKL